MSVLGKSLALVLVALFLMPLISIPEPTVKAQTNLMISSPPAMEWQQKYGNYTESTSNLIQTSDGGYAFVDLGWYYSTTISPATIYKTNSSGNMQWQKNINGTRYSFMTFISSFIIQTNDGGFEISGENSPFTENFAESPVIVKVDSQGNIQWTKNSSTVQTFGISLNGIQTTDGGFVYWNAEGLLAKTDSTNNTQWTTKLAITLDSGIPTLPIYEVPVSIRSVIETSDGGLAILGLADTENIHTATIYLYKTEPFLPLPSPSELPAPIATSTPIPTSTTIPTPISHNAFLFGLDWAQIAILVFMGIVVADAVFIAFKTLSKKRNTK